jgi:hypothetical protein
MHEEKVEFSVNVWNGSTTYNGIIGKGAGI